MKVVFCFNYSLSDEDEYIVEHLISDLKEELNIEIEKCQGKLNLEQLSEIDLIVTDSYQIATSVLAKEGEVIYWFRGHDDEIELDDESEEEIDCPVVVNTKYLGRKLIDELQQNTVIIHPGVKERFYQPISVEEMIETRKRKIIISGRELNPQILEYLIKTLEIINEGCRIKAMIMRKEEVEIDTDIEYEFILPGSLKERRIKYFRADLAIIVSEAEGFELTPLEIMACKTPVVFIYDRGVRDYASHNQNCRLLSKLHPKNLAITVLELLKNNIFAKNLAIAGCMTTKNYLWQDTVQDWCQLIKEELGITAEELERGIELNSVDGGEVQSAISEQLQRVTGTIENYEGDKLTESVDIVIVNYNTKEEIKDCLESIKEYTEYDYQVTVVDNNSTDGSLEYLESLDWIELIKNEENVGYARACNQGIKAGSGECVLLLNSDIKVTEGWLEPLVKAAQDDEVAVVGPKLVNEQEEIVGAGVTELDATCSPRGWKESDSEEKYNETEECISVGGAAYLIKRELIPEIGFFDERYFFYFEEADYSLRAREKGYKVIYCPESRIYHLHEGSLKEGDEVGRKRRNEYFAESKELFREKWDYLISAETKPQRAILSLGIIPWQFRYQRPQQILSRLSSDYQTLYVNSFNAPDQSWLQPEESIKVRKMESDLYVLSPPGYEAVYDLLMKDSGCKLLAQVINDTLDRLNMKSPILWLDSPYWAPIIEYLSSCKIIYNYMDKFEEFKELAENVETIKEFEEEILTVADLVVATSQPLLEKAEEYNENVHLLPNAAELEHFVQVQEQNLEVPVELEEVEKPVAGFFGAIAEWFDVDLVDRLAKDNPELSIVLIGDATVDVEKLEKRDNIYLLGEKPYEELPSYLQSFDVCMIPFLKNELTLSTDPVKLYEYLAAGKPVVSVDLPEVKKFSEVIEIAKDEKEFCEKVGKLCSEEEAINVEQIEELLAGNDWEDRVETIQELLVELQGEEEENEMIEVEDQKRLKDMMEKDLEESCKEDNEDTQDIEKVNSKKDEVSKRTKMDIELGEALVLEEEIEDKGEEEGVGWFENLWSKIKTTFTGLWDWLKGA